MPAAATNPKVPAPKKRNRKRKRRAASTDSSSSESESEAESEAPPPAPLVKPKQSVESSDDSSSSSSSSSSDSDSDSDVPSRTTATAVPQKHRPRSPSPPPVEIPSFIPPTEFSGPSEDELKTRFRKFYLSTVADGFREDLEEIRKEPNLGKTRLEMLVDSLAAGTEVFSSEEMEIVLDGGNRP